MDILQQLPQLEALCERLYHAQSQQERAQVEQMLAVFGQSTEYVVHLRAILDNSRSPYAQLLAASSLLKLVTENSLSPNMRLDMKQYFLAYLNSHAQDLEHFVATTLIQLLCRTVKLGWFDFVEHRSIASECKVLLQKGTSAHYLLGLRLLNTLVQEMNQPTPGRTLTQHRKVAVNFRDTVLLDVFATSLTALREMQDQNADAKLKEQGLSLALQCLSFDFVGTCTDDSTEEICTIQVPTAWRPAIEDPATIQLFLQYYATTTPPLSNEALECLVRLASVRRSLFTNDTERRRFLSLLVSGTRDILSSKRGLSEHSNYHELCRLLGRLKSNYQLSELVAVDQYPEWIQLVAELTISSLTSWQWASSSVYYLLGLWSRLVSSMPYLKADTPSQLDTNVPQITQAYITSRLESVTLVLSGAVAEDMLDSEEALGEQLDALPFLLRFQYEKSSAYLISLLDPLCDAYAQAGRTPPASAQVCIIEGQLTWLVHMVSAVIRGRLSSSSAESQEPIDGDLACRVFGLLSPMAEGYHAQRGGERSRQRLECAVMAFFQSFRKVYIGEQVMHSSKVYTKPAERLGLTDHLAVLNVMVTKIATNLSTYGACEEIVGQTLELFKDLAGGYMSGKLLLKLDSVGYLLSSHGPESVPFLDFPANARHRTTYYATLARLLFIEDTPAKFRTFVAPLQAVLVGIAGAASAAPTPAALRAAVPAATVAGLFRDLLGITSATSTRRTYGLVFDWLYPAHMTTLLRVLGAWADTPQVTTPLLKFVSEFAYNKSQRLTFESSSPNGILLFREVSKVIVTYGRAVLSNPPPASDPYVNRYKGTWVCLQTLARALSGSYVNFGVFDLYGDSALKDALEVALKLSMAMPLSEILAYRKVARAFFSLLEVLCTAHTSAVVSTEKPTFTFLLTALESGLRSLDTTTSSSCAAAVDNIAAFYFRHIIQGSESATAPPAGAAAMADHVRSAPGLLPEILKTLFEITLFDECSNQWSLSRPMLTLILVNESLYADLRASVIASQPPERRAHLSTCLDKLMEGVGRNLEPKNRDKFTQNLTVVRHDYRTRT